MSWWPDRTVAAKLEDPRVLTGSGNWFGELSRWSNLPRKILMTMSRVKDTTELFVFTFELNLAGTRLVPHIWRRPLQLHNCIIAEADALSSTAATASQDKALLRSVPSNPQSTSSPHQTCFWCNSGAAKPWLQCRDHSLGAHSFHEKCPCRLLSIERTDGGPFYNWNQNEKTISFFFTVLKSNWKTLIESFWRAKCLLCRTTLHFPLLLSCCGQIRIVVLTNWWITPADMDESQGKAPTFILCFWCNSGAAKPWHDNDRGCIASVPFCIKRCVLASRLDICQK